MWLNIPIIQVKKIFNDNFNITYYELYLNGNIEGRYQSISDVHWRVGLILSEASLSVEV